MTSLSLPLNIPAAWFAMVMGLGGLSIAWQRAEALTGLTPHAGYGMAWFALLVFSVLLFGYLRKIFRHHESFLAEFRHPTQIAFVGAVPISMEVLAVAFVHHHPMLAEGLLLVGMPLQLLVLTTMFRRWLVGEKIEPESITPAWFIPCVGGILVPLSGPQLGYVAAAWFFLCIGLLLWIFLMPILLARLIFIGPLPPAAQPSLLILLPPPALGMVAYVTMSGQLDVFAVSLFVLMLFIAAILLSLSRSLTRSNFNMSWWAFSFPTAACSGSCSFMALQTGAPAAKGLAYVALLICTGVILGLFVRTVVAVKQARVVST
ncbi:MAG: C4-dicarboxylate ABC transporter [Betaproteobacteria bacterium]|nr:C4-dicarboxylate ABC transporter [Betaproteobacteria bacterium]NDF50383.1 C4-dicarboxylate ABC transporter [Betaproteobacteria bacterium]